MFLVGTGSANVAGRLATDDCMTHEGRAAVHLKRRTAALAGSGLLLAGVAAGLAAAQTIHEAMDPARLAPHIFKVKFENRRVRVLDVTERNGETPPAHAHPDRLIVYLNACAWLAEDAGGKPYMASYTTGDVVWKPAEVHGGVASKVVNDCRRLDIELKERPALQ